MGTMFRPQMKVAVGPRLYVESTSRLTAAVSLYGEKAQCARQVVRSWRYVSLGLETLRIALRADLNKAVFH